MPIFQGMPKETADKYRTGAPDAYGNKAEQMVSDGDAPCRCCLRVIPKRKKMIVLAYRPFNSLQPYAETGPVFLCATACQPEDYEGAPEILTSPDYLLKGYSSDERIIYGTGKITATNEIESYADESVSYTHLTLPTILRV